VPSYVLLQSPNPEGLPMSASENSTCPLCDGPAQSADIGWTKRHFKCRLCTEFVLWLSVEARLARMARSERQNFSASAKATTDPNFIYVISGRLPESPPHIDIEGNAQLRSEAVAS
jgi:hypothetical protein